MRFRGVHFIRSHQSDSIKLPSLQVQMIYEHYDTPVEGVVFLTVDVQTRVVCATGSFDITKNMKT